MQLSTAALQHVSSVLHHVLPVAQQSVPHQAAEVLEHQYKAIAAAESLMVFRTSAVAQLTFTQAHLSPHCLPCLASFLVLFASWLRNFSPAVHAASMIRSTTGSSSSSSGWEGELAAPSPTPLQL
jgi:hypothetical protein